VSEQGYRGWLVDLDGTLYRSRPVKLLSGVELLTGGPHIWRMIAAFRREHESLRASLREPVDNPFRLQIERTAERLGCAPEVVEAHVREWMFCRPGKWLARAGRRWLLEAMVRFREQGGKTALVSDYPAHEKLKALHAGTLFDVVIASGEPSGPGRLKPRPDGFLLAAERLELSAGECLVIGDREDADGQAARNGGFAFQHVSQFRSSLQLAPVSQETDEEKCPSFISSTGC